MTVTVFLENKKGNFRTQQYMAPLKSQDYVLTTLNMMLNMAVNENCSYAIRNFKVILEENEKIC